MLTAAQHRAFQFIKQFIRDNGYAPSSKEIAQGIGITSRGVVHRYVTAIAKEGLIKVYPGKRRNIDLVRKQQQLPVLGRIAAGKPIEAVSNQELIDITDIFLGNNRFALKVDGNSMIDEGILDGDVVVCERSAIANNGDIVVALIDNDAATLKRFYNNQDGTVTLVAANPQIAPMIYNAARVHLQGIYVGLLRYL